MDEMKRRRGRIEEKEEGRMGVRKKKRTERSIEQRIKGMILSKKDRWTGISEERRKENERNEQK